MIDNKGNISGCGCLVVLIAAWIVVAITTFPFETFASTAVAVTIVFIYFIYQLTK